MPLVLLGLSLLVGGLLIWSWMRGAGSHELESAAGWSLAILVLLLPLALVLATGSGQAYVAVVWIAGALLVCWFLRREAQRRASRRLLETKFLQVVVQPDGAAADAAVLAGSQAGRRLSRLGRAELLALRGETAVDPLSHRLVEAFLDRWHPGWRRGAIAGVVGGSGHRPFGAPH